MIELRPYQIEALETVMSDLVRDPHVLLQASTGAGKTIIFAELIRRWLTEYTDLRIVVVAHRRELITQARDKLLKVWPAGGAGQIGLACASVGEVDTGRPVIIGSVQTLARRKLRHPADLLIIDESHHLPALETFSQYHTLIKRYREARPNLRVFGCTATPFRLGHGYIYGDDCKPGRTNLFPKLNYQIGMDELIAGSYLVPWRAKEGRSMADDLAKVKLTNGDYDVQGLNSLYLRGVNIQSAVDAYQEYGEARDKVLIFAVSIEHAEMLAEAFRQAGQVAGAVHSQLPDRERSRLLSAFDHGDLKILVNVGILTEGWDSPRVNLIMMCRPTKAPALFVQMIGRGTRLHPGKTDLLILDLADNFKAHGDPGAPNVVVPGAPGDGPAPYKVCPDCAALLPTATLTCRDCGHHWEVRLEEKPVAVMAAVNLPPAGKSRVLSWEGRGHVTYRGHYFFLLEVHCVPGGLVRHWLDIEGQASPVGRSKAHRLWWRLTGQSQTPATVREALERKGELRLPQYVTVFKEKGYRKIKELNG